MSGRRFPCARAVAAGLFALCVTSTCAGTFSTHAPIQAVVAELDRAPAGMRIAFVQAAVAEIAAAYLDALADARQGARADDAGWIVATEAYVADLAAAARAAERGAEIRLLFGPEGALRVVIASNPARQFMLAAPRPHERERLERAVVARFCRQTDCGAAGTGKPGAALTSAAEHRAATRAHHTGDGLTCESGAPRHGKLHRSACAQLMQELRLLVRAMRGYADPVDWSRFGPVRRRGASHVVPVDAAGRVVSADLPALFQSPAVLAEAIPWIRARLAGKVASLQLTPPARLVYRSRMASG